MHCFRKTTLQYNCDLLFEKSRDSWTGQGERAGVECTIAARYLQGTVSLSNKTVIKYWDVTNDLFYLR